ncbi:ribonuclease T2 [Actibacterium sp. XHP0104]|uniref:ribonuclease T2 n=1 Tax=Actibacterium sp. XHP0104 TaxID=2984335 RepID=UPI0021E8071E|nr:ribonuclease T2 [Actibacterium sp. XHP0104]MCV2882844.1 ribonuclease T2 [Actibacterium sp. XHP0104]
MRWVLVLLLTAGLARAEGDKAGDFDYYLLSLSWSPTWCALEGEARNSPQCDAGAGFGWVLHGLWPQYEQGWPSHCYSTHRNPSRSQTAAMADIMGTSGLAWYQWKKHGRCSGLPAQDYYDQARAAYNAVTRPEVFRRLKGPIRLPARVIEEAFIAENPQLWPDAITVTCRDNRIQEVRICLTRDLQPRDCGADTVRDCTLPRALMDPVD